MKSLFFCIIILEIQHYFFFLIGFQFTRIIFFVMFLHAIQVELVALPVRMILLFQKRNDILGTWKYYFPNLFNNIDLSIADMMSFL